MPLIAARFDSVIRLHSGRLSSAFPQQRCTRGFIAAGLQIVRWILHMTGEIAKANHCGRLFYAKSLILIMSSTNQFPRSLCHDCGRGFVVFCPEKSCLQFLRYNSSRLMIFLRSITSPAPLQSWEEWGTKNQRGGQKRKPESTISPTTIIPHPSWFTRTDRRSWRQCCIWESA